MFETWGDDIIASQKDWLYCTHAMVSFSDVSTLGASFTNNIAVSGSQNAGSIWTKCQYDTKCLRIQLKVSPCGRDLSIKIQKSPQFNIL